MKGENKMLKIQDDLDYILSRYRSSKIKIEAAFIIPVDDYGLEMFCYTPYNVNYPGSYEINLKAVNGDTSKLPCWSSPEYTKQFYLCSKTKRPLNYMRDCSKCKFTLEKAKSFNLKMTAEQNDLSAKDIIKELRPMLEATDKMLPKPLDRIRIISLDNFGTYSKVIQLQYEGGKIVDITKEQPRITGDN